MKNMDFEIKAWLYVNVAQHFRAHSNAAYIFTTQSRQLWKSTLLRVESHY